MAVRGHSEGAAAAAAAAEEEEEEALLTGRSRMQDGHARLTTRNMK
jgi:hypothetical protein